MMSCTTVYSVAYHVIWFGCFCSTAWELCNTPKMKLPRDDKTEKKRPPQKDQRKRVGRVDVLAPTRAQEAKKTATKKAAAAKKKNR